MDGNANLEVRIVLAAGFGETAVNRRKLIADLRELKNDFGLDLGTHIRLLSHEHFLHCHNKLIIVDTKRVLISSQNWSKPGVSQNREAGLLIEYPELADYYRTIFEFDWSTGVTSFEEAPDLLIFPDGPAMLAASDAVRLNPGDYIEV